MCNSLKALKANKVCRPWMTILCHNQSSRSVRITWRIWSRHKDCNRSEWLFRQAFIWHSYAGNQFWQHIHQNHAGLMFVWISAGLLSRRPHQLARNACWCNKASRCVCALRGVHQLQCTMLFALWESNRRPDAVCRACMTFKFKIQPGRTSQTNHLMNRTAEQIKRNRPNNLNG